MGSVAQSLGLGAEIEFEGKKWKLSPWKYRIQGQFERYLEGNALDSVRRLRSHLAPEEYQDQLQRVLRDIATGIYTFGSQAAYNALQSLPHLRQLFLLMLADNHPQEATPELVARMFEDNLEGCTQAMTAANADPNSPPPAKES